MYTLHKVVVLSHIVFLANFTLAEESGTTRVTLDVPTPRPQAFVGHNTNIAGEPRFPFDHPKAIPLVHTLGPNMLRYPGGTVAMTFDWEWERTLRFKSNARFPLSGFLALCDRVTAEPIFCVNVYQTQRGEVEDQKVRDELVSDAVKWLDYVNGDPDEQIVLNREDGSVSAKKLGRRIKYWEIGNEAYWNAVYPKFSKADTNENGIFDGAELYARLGRRIADALREKMREIDPEFELMIIATGAASGNAYKKQTWIKNLEETGANDMFKKWNEALAEKPRWWDALTIHDYIDAVDQEIEQELQWAWGANLKNTELHQRYFREVLGTEKTIPLFHTEWGALLLPLNVCGSRGRGYHNTFAGALINADTALHLSSQPEANRALLNHQLYERYCAMLDWDREKQQPWLTTQGWAASGYQPLLNGAAAQFGEKLEGGPELRGLFQFKDVRIPAVTVKVFEMKDGKVGLGLINKTGATQHVQFDGDAPVYGTGKLWQLAGPLMKKNSGLADDLKPVEEEFTLQRGKPLELPGYSFTRILVRPAN